MGRRPSRRRTASGTGPNRASATGTCRHVAAATDAGVRERRQGDLTGTNGTGDTPASSWTGRGPQVGRTASKQAERRSTFSICRQTGYNHPQAGATPAGHPPPSVSWLTSCELGRCVQNSPHNHPTTRRAGDEPWRPAASRCRALGRSRTVGLAGAYPQSFGRIGLASENASTDNQGAASWQVQIPIRVTRALG